MSVDACAELRSISSVPRLASDARAAAPLKPHRAGCERPRTCSLAAAPIASGARTSLVGLFDRIHVRLELMLLSLGRDASTRTFRTSAEAHQRSRESWRLESPAYLPADRATLSR